MTGAVSPRRPQLRERDVELATAVGRSPALRSWRARLLTLRVVRANRFVRGLFVGRETSWDVRLEADDGWSAEGEVVDVEPLIDLEAIAAELSATDACVARSRVRRIVRWLLWDELWLSQDRLSRRLMDAEPIEEP